MINSFLYKNLAKRLFLLCLCCIWPSLSVAATAFNVSAGNNQTVMIKKPVTLTGSATGAKGGVKKWYWQQLQGPAKVALKTAINNANASFTPTTVGNYIFTLTATDSSKANAYALVFVTVTNANKPIAVSLVTQNFQANQAINLGSSQTLKWTLRNDSGISLNNVVLKLGTGNGGLNYSSITPSAITSWANGESKEFSVTVSAPNTITAGVYTQNWILNYNLNQALTLSNSSVGIQSSLSIAQKIQLSQISQSLANNAYHSGAIINQGSSYVISWNIRNDSNINLSNITLAPGTATGGLSIGTISPNTLNNWAIGESKTFQVQISVPSNTLSGNHSQNWGLVYNGNPYLNISFNLQTPVPDISLSLINAYFTDTNEALIDGAVITQGTSRTINWQVKNNSNINLSNVTLSPNTTSGKLQIGSITPASISTWNIGDTKTFAVSLTAPTSAWSNRHSKTWQLSIDGQQISLNDHKSLGFSLTTNPLECAISTSNSSKGLIKISSNGSPTINKSSAWSCVQDNNTGLIWEVKTNDNGLRDYRQTYNWTQANTYVTSVNAQGLCGVNNWRLPNAEELLTLISAKETDGVYNLQRLINIDFFPFSQASEYWSASDSANQFAWGVSFKDSQHGGGDYSLLDETSLHYVRLVHDLP